MGLVFFVSGCGASAPSKGPAVGGSSSPKAGKAPAAAIAQGEEETSEESSSKSWIGAATPSSFVFASSSEQRAAVWIDVPKVKQRNHVPVALTLTVDTSGSMRGDKIAQARRSAQALVDKLADGDIVTIHTFSDSVRVRVPATTLTAESRRQIKNVIEELGAEGGTNMFDALNSAESETWRADAQHPVKRVIMISDGKATVGPTDPESFGRLAELGFGRGVQVSAFGVGLDYDENLLNTLAVRSSGRLYHIGDNDDLRRVVERETELVESTAATEAFVELVPAPGVRLLGADGISAGWHGSTLRVPVGTLFGGQSREVVVRFVLDDRQEGGKSLFAARLVFKDPGDGGIERVQETLARSTVTGDERLLETAHNPRAQAILATVHAASLATTASTRVNSGDFDTADRELERAATELRKSAAIAKPGAVRDKMVANAQRMEGARKAVQASAKAPPAKRAAAGRARALELNDAAMDFNGF
jgi:Ca-activated chloride channel family protein